MGSDTKEVTKVLLDNLILKGENTTYDELPTKYKLKDVSFTLLSSTLKKETGTELNINKDYQSLNLVIGEENVINAGLLLCDQGLIKHSKIVCTRWNGLEKASFSNDVIDDKEYTGSIISLLENAEIFIRNNSKLSWKVIGMKRVEKEDYPLKAIREAIVNAIIHRDYQVVGSEIHIDMFDDRLEITSPGGMADGSDIQNLDITKIYSMRRNRIISDVFNRLHYMDRRGSGLSRIIKAYDDFGIKPSFYSSESSFNVTFPNLGYINNDVAVDQKNEVNDYDYFTLRAYKKLSTKVKVDFLLKLEKHFGKFNYSYKFTRKDIEEIYNVKKTRAIEILNILLEAELIDILSNGEYKFK